LSLKLSRAPCRHLSSHTFISTTTHPLLRLPTPLLPPLPLPPSTPIPPPSIPLIPPPLLPHPPLHPLPPIIQPLPILPTQLPPHPTLPPRPHRPIQLHHPLLPRQHLLPLTLKPRPFRPRLDLPLKLHQILTLPHLHLRPRQQLLLFLLFQNILHLLLQPLNPPSPLIRQPRLHNSRNDLRALRFSALDSLLDDFTVGLGGDGAGAAVAAGAGSTANPMEVNFVGLGRFVIYYCGYVGDVETAGGEVGGEEVGGGGGAEGG